LSYLSDIILGEVFRRLGSSQIPKSVNPLIFNFQFLIRLA
jgi:hypothetical protein